MKPRNIPYPMEDIKKWLSDLGWRGSVPTSKAESMALLRRLQEKKDFSGNQFEYLLSLGYYGDQPKNMADAAELIEKTKKNRNWWKSKSQKKADRKQWLSDRREENRDNIRSDIEDTAEFFRDMGRDADIGEALVGWVIDFTPNARCKYRSEYAGLIYTADTTVEDLVKHMPPFDDCPTDCEECNLEVKFFKDTGPNLNVFLWDGMKKRKSVPKYIISPKLH